MAAHVLYPLYECLNNYPELGKSNSTAATLGPRRMASGRATFWNRRVRSSHPKLTPTIHLMRGEQLTSGASHGPCHTSS